MEELVPLMTGMVMKPNYIVEEDERRKRKRDWINVVRLCE